MASKQHKIVELFAGIAGVSLGFWSTGYFRPGYLVDIDEDAKEAFAHNYPELLEHYSCEDIRQVDAANILAVTKTAPTGIVGCPPCQGLSDVGLRKHVDSRNHLVDHYFRIVRSLRPAFFVMENVPRVLSYRRFQEQLRQTSEEYAIWTGVLNAAEYGVPQTRQRAIVIGYRNDLGITPTPPQPTHTGSRDLFAYDLQRFVSPSDTRYAKSVLGSYARLKTNPPASDKKTVDTACEPFVTCSDALGDLPQTASKPQAYPIKTATPYQQRMRGRKKAVENHIAWNHGPELIQKMEKLQPGESQLSQLGRDKHPYFSQAYARLHPEGLARTITTNFHNAGAGRFWHYAAPRTLTVREAARLQSFPDRFRFPKDMPMTVQERLLGNAFPPLWAQAVASHIYQEIKDLI